MEVTTTKNQDGTLRALNNRNVQMIAIGGTIGTGLFLGSGDTIYKTGPSVLLIYLVLGIFFFLMMRAIGEMFYSDTSQHTFVSFVSKYLGKSTGYFTGWTYWLGLIFASMAELIAMASYFQFWFPSAPAWLVEIIFLGALTLVNLIAVKLFGEAEFWFSMIKIIAIIALIVTGIFMVVKHTPTPLGNASVSNITNHFTLFPHGVSSFISAFPMVFFAFLGIESVSITFGEAKDPKRIIKTATNETLFRILLFYIGALAVIMLVIPWSSISATKSPFVQIFSLAGLPAAAAIINFVVITAAASALNSTIFSAGRHFYQLATEGNPQGWIYRKFAVISKNGTPVPAILISAFLILLTPIMSISKDTNSVFMIVTGSSSDMNILVYILTILAHRKYRQSSDYLPNGFKMPGYKVTSPLTLLFFVAIFISLFFIPDDVVGAIGTIAWVVIFGGLIYLKERRPALS